MPTPSDSHLLSLHDALPIFESAALVVASLDRRGDGAGHRVRRRQRDRLPDDVGLVATQRGDTARVAAPALVVKDERLSGDRTSTRLNSSHLVISYAVFCLKK